VRGWVRVVSDRAAKQVGRLGLDIQKEPRFRDSIAVVDGQLDPLSESGTILLFEKQAKKLDVRLGDMVTLYAQTARGVVNTIDCRVVAIAREMGLLSKFNAYVSHETLRTLFQVRPDVTGVIQVYLPDALVDEANELSSRVRDALELAGHRVMDRDPRPFWMKLQDTVREDWAGQKLDVSTWSEELSFMTWSVELLSALKTALMIVLVTIIVIGVSNALWVSIRERTREIGTLRAKHLTGKEHEEIHRRIGAAESFAKVATAIGCSTKTIQRLLTIPKKSKLRSPRGGRCSGSVTCRRSLTCCHVRK